jgi:hypothetical protein
MKQTLKLIITTLLMAGCSGKLLPQPTSTPMLTSTATMQSTKTPVSTSIVTATPDLVAEYTAMLPSIPPGFEWKVMPDLKLAVLIPDGWYFKEETRTDSSFAGGVYVSQENIDNVGRYSIGQAVFMYPDENIDEDLEGFATGLLADLANASTTTKILDSWDYKADTYVVHHLRIEASYPYETEVNRNKTIQYSTLVFNDAVYLTIFESPTAHWEQVVKDYGILLDYVIVFGK